MLGYTIDGSREAVSRSDPLRPLRHLIHADGYVMLHLRSVIANLDIIKREIKVIQELLELEPDSKCEFENLE